MTAVRPPADALPRKHGRVERARVSAIVAWRFWEVAEQDGRPLLASPFWAVLWPVGEPLRAECLGLKLPGGSPGGDHEPPGEHCRCGIYGASYRELRSYLLADLVPPSAVPVLGRVHLWGAVVSDEHGFRAARAYPERLMISTLSRRALELAEDLGAYGVPVRVLDLAETLQTLKPETRLRVVR